MYDEYLNELLSEWTNYNNKHNKISLQDYLVNVLNYTPKEATFIVMTTKTFC